MAPFSVRVIPIREKSNALSQSKKREWSGRGGIAYCRTYSPIPDGEEGLQVEVGFIGGVTPKFSAYLPVQPFCGGLGKTVGEGLEQEGGIVVSVPTQELYATLYLVSGGDGE